MGNQNGAVSGVLREHVLVPCFLFFMCLQHMHCALDRETGMGTYGFHTTKC
jgi:hypothetical protein